MLAIPFSVVAVALVGPEVTPSVVVPTAAPVPFLARPPPRQSRLDTPSRRTEASPPARLRHIVATPSAVLPDATIDT